MSNKRKKSSTNSTVQKIKKCKIEKIIPNEIIIEILSYLMIDLFHVEYNNHGIIKRKNKDDLFRPMNIINNMMLTSRNFKYLFEMCFKEFFVKDFKVTLDLNLTRGHLMKSVILNSILYVNLSRSQNYFLTLMDEIDNYLNFSTTCVSESNHEKIYNLFKHLCCFDTFYDIISGFHIPIYNSVTNNTYCSCTGRSTIYCDHTLTDRYRNNLNDYYFNYD